MASSHIPQTLGTLLPSVIKKMGIKRKLDEAQAVEAWAILAGPRINGITERVWVRGPILYVKVTSSAWRHALYHQRALWLKRLNERLGTAVVEEIRFC